jgi:hypothetical protein
LIKKESFGNVTAKNIDPGDLVQWSKWDDNKKTYDEKFGIVVSINEEVRGSRMVSVARVVPLSDTATERVFFTMSLKLVSKGSKDIKKN